MTSPASGIRGRIADDLTVNVAMIDVADVRLVEKGLAVSDQVLGETTASVPKVTIGDDERNALWETSDRTVDQAKVAAVPGKVVVPEIVFVRVLTAIEDDKAMEASAATGVHHTIDESPTIGPARMSVHESLKARR